MNVGVKVRFTGLLLGLGLLGVLIVVEVLNSQRQAGELRDRLTQVDSESFNIADHFKDSLREAYDKMRAYRNAAELRRR